MYMVLIIVGLLLIICTIPVWIVIFSVNDFVLVQLILLSMLDIVGIILFCTGMKKIIKDSKTKKNGVETYAQLMNVKRIGENEDGSPKLKGEFKVFNPNTLQTEDVTEMLKGTKISYVHIGKIVKVKYYEGDINIDKIVDISEVPGDASKFFRTDISPTPEYILGIDKNNSDEK